MREFLEVRASEVLEIGSLHDNTRLHVEDLRAHPVQLQLGDLRRVDYERSILCWHNYLLSTARIHYFSNRHLDVTQAAGWKVRYHELDDKWGSGDLPGMSYSIMQSVQICRMASIRSFGREGFPRMTPL